MGENFQKRPSGLRESVSDAIFVAWKKYSGQIDAGDIASFFDEEARHYLQPQNPWQSSSQALNIHHGPFCSAGVADAGLPAETHEMSSKSGRSSDRSIVALRLTRMSRSPEVTNALLESPILGSCRKQVTDHGLEVMPAWACGAKVLVPLSQAFFIQECFELKHHHVIAFARDVPHVQSALQALPCKTRPRIASDHRFNRLDTRGAVADGDTSGVVADQCPHTDALCDVDVVIEHEFLTDSSVAACS